MEFTGSSGVLCPWPADASLVSTPSGPTSPLSCQLAKHLLGLFPNPFIPAGFPWLQNSIEYHASVGPLCPQTHLLPPLFGSIMQRSDSTTSAGSSSIRLVEGTRRRWKDGRKRGCFILCLRGPPWQLGLLCGSGKCKTGRDAPASTGDPSGNTPPCDPLAEWWQWLPAVATLGAPPHLCLVSQLFHHLGCQ